MSTKPYNDDAMLTAYALGELEGSDAQEMEARVDSDPEAQAQVEAIRRTAGRLREALKAEQPVAPVAVAGGAPVGQASRLPSEAPGQQANRPPAKSFAWRLALAAAAALAVGLVAWAAFEAGRQQEARLAVMTVERQAGEADALRDRGNVQAPAIPGPREQEETGLQAQRQAARGRPLPQPESVASPAAPAQQAQQLRDELQSLAESSPETARRQGQQEAAGAGDAPASASPELAPGGGGISLEQQRRLAAASDELGYTTRALRSATGYRAATFDDPRGLLPPAAAAQVPPADDPELPGRFRDDFTTDAFDRIVDNPFTRVADHPLSTFSVDVDTASYAIVRRMLTSGRLPPPDAVRIEELVNYFDYSYQPPTPGSRHPFDAHVAVASAPWNPQHRLVRIGIKGMEIRPEERPASNLVFLIDVSGSMNRPDRLPLVKQAMGMLAEQLDERDRVAIVVYAGSSGLVLPSTRGDQADDIRRALARLEAGGSTNGGEGIELAYRVAKENFIAGGINRVILCTDGDFNIGVTDRGRLTRLVEEQAKSGVYLSILGFGMGNLKDATMEELTNKGEGNYGYIDTEHEARKLLVEQLQGTLQTIAKDVKIQVEFNPATVAGYRLIGYENRILAKEDFNDDEKDAGDIGAGHEVTALYEVVPVHAARMAQARPEVDELRYQRRPEPAPAALLGEMLTVKLRYKAPDAPKEQGTSTLVEFPVTYEGQGFEAADADFRHAAAVAGFGMLLRDSPYKGDLTWERLKEMTRDLEGLRRADFPGENTEMPRRLEFRELVLKAAELAAGAADPQPRR